MEALRVPLRAVGRAALAAIFITGGADALLDPGPRAPRAAELGVPLEPELAVRLNGAVMLAGGVALALGLWPRLAAGALAGSLVPTTLAGHPYWRLADPAARRQQRIHFFKNVGLFGGRCWYWLSGQPAAADNPSQGVPEVAGVTGCRWQCPPRGPVSA
jgi:putative oxidoreductase